MKLFRFLNEIVTHCLAVLGLLFTGATLYEALRQWAKKRKKAEKAQKKSSEQ